MSGPYGVSALTYLEAGFSPLPTLGKLLKVTKASGRHPIASKEQIERWSKSYSPFNIALRLPTNVIALDIDAYKGDLEKLTELEEKLGKLPPTWNSDSRGGHGGKVLYRVPPGIKWMSNINGITIVQHTHRYVMVFPSFNKTSESKYVWYLGLGGELVSDNMIPSVEDLTELPKEWIEALTKSETIQAWSSTVGINNDDLDMFNDEAPCKYMELLTEMCLKRFENADSVHDTGLSILGLLITAATDGHSGVQEAIDKMSIAFCSSNRSRDLVSEWNNLLSFVLAQVDPERINDVDVCTMKLVLGVDYETQIMQDIAKAMAKGLTASMAIRLKFGKIRK
jgi:hypothetical protein